MRSDRDPERWLRAAGGAEEAATRGRLESYSPAEPP